MANWSVISAVGRFVVLNNATNFGTEFFVTFRIKYTPSLIGSFVEPPHLAWDEIIMFNDYTDMTRWEFVGNMYTHKPASPTVGVWAQRYFRAYCHAHGTPHPDQGRWKGHSKLFDKNGTAVKGSALGTHTGVDKQNKAVQNYLKKHGGILEIEVHDIPSFVKPTGGKVYDQERVLVFNCGVTGMGPRVAAYQHLKMDSTQPATSWTNTFHIGGTAPGLKTTGLKMTQNLGVSTPVPALPAGGIL